MYPPSRCKLVPQRVLFGIDIVADFMSITASHAPVSSNIIRDSLLGFRLSVAEHVVDVNDNIGINIIEHDVIAV